MKYLCLVYLDEKRLDELPDEDCVAYDTAIRASGQCLASEALESVQTATTVRIRNGKVAITDGPFAETKEVLGGYALFNAASKDEAIEHTRRFLDHVGQGTWEGTWETYQLFEMLPCPAGR